MAEESGQTVSYAIRQTHIAIGRALQQRLALYNMTGPQLIFMREIWLEEGLSQRELSARVGTAESTTVSALRVLERRKLIRRTAKSKDRRAVRVYLTPAGRQLEVDIMPKIHAANEAVVKGIPQHEMNVFARVLTRIRDNAEALGGVRLGPEVDAGILAAESVRCAALLAPVKRISRNRQQSGPKADVIGDAKVAS